jgi:chromosome segregation ATPase
VQAELEILIEKLMSELELERNQKRRLNEEIKRMQRETMLLEKEITAKNTKIYELEMTHLKSNRAKPTPNQYTKAHDQRPAKLSKDQPVAKSDRTAKTLTLMYG